MSKKAENTDRLPPFDEKAERGVLGCIMLSPEGCLNECQELGVAVEWFYSLEHQQIYRAMETLHRAGKAVDFLLLSDQLQQFKHTLERVGGVGYVNDLCDATPSATQLEYYLEIVADHYRMRRLIKVATEAMEQCYAPGERDVPAMVAQAEKDILLLAENRAGTSEVAIKTSLRTVVDDLEKYHRGHAQIRGLTTGLEYLDKLLLGMGGENGNMLVFSGRPGTGKTSLAMDLVLHAAIDYVWFTPVMGENGEQKKDGEKLVWQEHKGVPCAVFSLEMSNDSLVKRMLFQRAGADLQRWRTGFAEQRDMTALVKASGDIAKAKIWIDDTARCTIGSLKARARRLARQHGIKLFVVDYIQLMRGDSKRFREDRVQELGEISAELQGLTKELGVPFLILAQMNRDFEKDPNRVPRLSDLKDCGAIEQDADLVAFLYKPKFTKEKQATYETMMEDVFGDDWSRKAQRVDLLVDKYRYGPTGQVQLMFRKSSTHFEDYNVWLKSIGQKAPAKGERPPMPTDAELGV